jgi:hypothetical protein
MRLGSRATVGARFWSLGRSAGARSRVRGCAKASRTAGCESDRASPGLTQVGPGLAGVAGAALRGLLAEPWVQDAPTLAERCRSALGARSGTQTAT